ncbi:MAG TPA: hypothetical protein VGM94_09535 [Galbitalea sp.]
MTEGVELLTAYISIVTESSKVAPEIKRSLGIASKEGDRAGKAAGSKFGTSFGKSAKSLLAGAGIGLGVASAVGFLKDANAEARESQKVGALTNQVIKSTGGIAKVSAKHVNDLSNALSKKVGVDDEIIQSGENVLLTFKNVRNEVGQSNKIFDRATAAATDLASTPLLGGNVTAAAKQLGKALNDPVRGTLALTRAGVTFTDQQKAQIKALVKSGKTLQAQKVILKEVESQVGGAAAAQATAGDKAKVALKNLEETIGTGLLPVVDDLSNFFTTKAAPAISKFAQGMQDGTGAGGDFAKDLREVAGVAKTLIGFIDGLPGPVKKFGIEVAIGAVVLGKLNSGLDTVIGKGKNFRTELSQIGTQGSKFNTTLRNMAGAGGLLAFQDGLHRTDHALGTTETTLGGFAAGFAVGGPIGGGIGAGIGLFIGLKNAIDGSSNAKLPTPKQLGLTAIIGALDEANGLVADKNGIVAFINGKTKGTPPKGVAVGTTIRDTARLYGIPDRSVVGALAGSTADFLRIKKILDAAARKPGQAGLLAQGDRATILDSIKAFRKSEEQKRFQLLKTIALTKNYGKSLDALPPNKRTVVQATGILPTVRGVEDMAKKIRATPKEVDILFAAAGVPETKTDAKRVNDAVAAVPKTHKTTFTADTSNVTTKLSNLYHLTQSIITGFGSINIPGGRATGGPVRAGQPYIVGEHRPELFVPDANGRILPRVPSAMSGPISSAGQRTALTITNWQTGTGYFEDVADSRVGAQRGLDGMQNRAFG